MTKWALGQVRAHIPESPQNVGFLYRARFAPSARTYFIFSRRPSASTAESLREVVSKTLGP